MTFITCRHNKLDDLFVIINSCDDENRMWLSDGEMDGKNYTARQENLKKSFLDFSCNTTFHGLRYIADSNSLGRR